MRDISFGSYLAGMHDDADVVYPSVRENALKQVLEMMRKDEDFIRKYPPELLDFQNETWNKIGKMMLSWGCVRNSEAINV